MQLRRFFLVLCFLTGSTLLLQAQKLTTQQYIAMYKDVAIAEMQRSGVPASIKLAQGILETQSGNGWLVQNSNNHFGIKCKNNWSGESVRYDDDARQECFRKYNSAAESYKDHSDFLRNNPRYAFLFQFQEEDYKSWAYGLKQAGYATSNTYPQQLIKLIEDYNLQQYTLEGEGVAKAGTGNGKTGDDFPSSTQPAKNTTIPATGKSTAITTANAPKGIFKINDRKVIVVPANKALIQVANEQDVKLRNLVHYNDLENDEPHAKPMFIFLQKKGKSGKNDYHVVAKGESMYDIAQAEGIQLRWLRRRNKMKEGQEPAVGERLALDGYAKSTPKLSKEAPVEDPTEGDLNPGQIVEDVKTEMERQEEMAAQNAQQQQNNTAKNNLPPGMLEDLQKAGATVTTSGGGSAPAAPVKTQPVQTSPAQTRPVQTQPAPPAQTYPAQPVQTPAQSAPVQTQPAPPAQTYPAQPVQTTPAQSAPVQTQPAPPAQTYPAQPVPDATAPAVSNPVRDGNSLFHVVQTKETLYGLSKRYNVSVEQLKEWNNMETFDIKIGQRLLVGKM